MADGESARHNVRVGADWILGILLGLVAAVGVGRAAWSASKRGAAWQRDVTERWRSIAEALGAELSVAGAGALAPRRLTMARPHHEARAIAETTVPVEQTSLSHTRAAAAFTLGRGPRFEMRERTLADVPAIERAVLGDHEALIRRVKLTATDAKATEALFTDAAREKAAAFPRPLSLRSSGAVVELVWDGVELEPRVLDVALSLVGELALHGVSVLRELSTLEGATYEPERGVVEVRRASAHVTLAARSGEAGLLYVASAEPRRALPEFEVRIDADGGVDGEVPPGVIDPAVAAELTRVGAATLGAADGRIELAWDAPPDGTQGEAAVRLLAPVAKGGASQGAFR